MSSHLGWRAGAVLLVVVGAFALIATRTPRLGLDLRGGTQIVLEAAPSGQEAVDRDVLDRTVEVLRRRVDQLGVAEPVLQRSGSRRIIVELPGVSDPREAVAVIGKTAQLSMHPVLGTAPPSAVPSALPAPASPNGEVILADESGSRLRLGPAALSGDSVGDARAELDPGGFGWQVGVEFRGDGTRAWEKLTADAACASPGDPRRRIAIVLDQTIISSPQVSPGIACGQGISGGSTLITGRFTDAEARDLALLVRAGALPVPVEVVEQRTIGPTLGEQAIGASARAALIGSAATILYILLYYRLLGALAAVGLLLYGAVSFAVLLALDVTLTLPGIAGFVLAIGMAVDANVLVFERMKEEAAAGARVALAARRGFERAWSAIADANATTVIAAALLFFLASGAVRGFGVTLTVGVAVSMFTALIVTRVLVDLVLAAAPIARRPEVLGLEVGAKLRRWIEVRRPDLLRRWTAWLAMSAMLVAITFAGVAARGLDFGLEFTGGRLVEYSAARPVDLDDARAALGRAGFARALVNESGDGHVTVRAASLSEEDEARASAAIGEVGGGGVEKIRDEFIGPTIGGELRNKALIALGLALGAQLLYMAIRFRWTFGAAAVVTMLHDVAILIGVFAWLGKTLDGVFLASLLTVIGYSVNDSVVVFDRIREQRVLRPRDPLIAVANDACLQTVPRTINTGLGALFILVALWVLGGETLADFALALLIGIVVGTYSSVFTATPLALAMERMSPSPPAAARRAPARAAASGPLRAKTARNRT